MTETAALISRLTAIVGAGTMGVSIAAIRTALLRHRRRPGAPERLCIQQER
jgi:hypothetical protein